MPNLNTALDMHIEVLQGLQKIDSFQQDMFEPEEVDLQLNKQQDRFIEQLVNEEFQDKQIRLDYIKNIVVKNRKVQLFVPGVTDPDFESNMVYGLLPENYIHLVSDRSQVSYSTAAGLCESFPDIGTTDYIEYMSVVPFPTTTLTEPPYYNKFEILIDGIVAPVFETGYEINTNNFEGFQEVSEISPLVDEVLFNQLPGKPDTRVYWERYRGAYYPNSFIFVSEDITPAFALIRVYEPTGVGVEAQSQSNFTGTTYQVYDQVAISEVDSLVQRYAENKLAEGDELYEFSKNNFYKPQRKEPHSNIADDVIRLYREDSFLITDLIIDYIRKPRRISLSLNQGCELAGTAPRLIVDGAVEYFKLIIENPAYQGILQDNQLRNQNTLT